MTCAFRVYESTLCNMDKDVIMNGTGKDDIGALGETGITMRLINDWRTKPEDLPGPSYTTFTYKAGNLVATNAFCNNPVAPASFTTIVLAQALAVSTATDTSTDVTKIRRYLTNKKSITGTTLTVRNDTDTADDQTYTLDDGDSPKSQTPV
jgi:ABC-type branched-subunit amino acid transport system substrate-binding protein